MEFRKLGRTGVDVSLICLGTMTWGSQNSEAEAHEQLDCAWNQGINFLDTAEGYPTTPARQETQGRTEEYVGSWLAARPGDARRFRPDGNLLNRANIEAGVDASLKRLQTGYVDLYQVYDDRAAQGRYRQRRCDARR